MSGVVYLLSWIDGDSCGDPPGEIVAAAFLDRGDAEREQRRIADAIKRSRAEGGHGCFDRGVRIEEVALDVPIAVPSSLYLHKHLTEEHR